MSKFGVSAEKDAQLKARMLKLGIKEDELVEKFIRGSGSGGQKVNKTSSCVYLVHKPSGMEVKCQKDRSQALNRYHARRELCEKFEEQVLGAKSKRKQEIEKIKRQKRKRSKRAKEKILKEKKHRSETKMNRKPVKD